MHIAGYRNRINVDTASRKLHVFDALRFISVAETGGMFKKGARS
jgi:hypothetical protein